MASLPRLATKTGESSSSTTNLVAYYIQYQVKTLLSAPLPFHQHLHCSPLLAIPKSSLSMMSIPVSTLAI
jgi:hypothetical protein